MHINQTKNMMKIVTLSDTHNLHELIEDVPAGDVLVCAGDHTRRGSLEDLHEFNTYLGTLPHQHKIFVAGNHDWCFQDFPEESIEILTNAIYLQDSAVVIDGVKFYGSPWQPEFFNWAFNLSRGNALREKWELIHTDTDVLITHGPPMGILDMVESGHVGCEELTKLVMKIKPQVHIFGHIHEGYGQIEVEGTMFINASNCTGRYAPTNRPIVYEIDHARLYEHAQEDKVRRPVMSI